MHRFVILAWNAMDAEASRSARQMLAVMQHATPGWRLALEASGINVVVHQDSGWQSTQTYPLHGSRGIVIGDLFRQGQSVDHPRLDEFATARITNTKGRDLVQSYWGRYIAFIHSSPDSWHLLRDPTGALRCYETEKERVTIIFSHLIDWRCIAADQISIDWSHVASYLEFDRLVTPTTGYSNIQEVRAGESIEFRQGKAQGRTEYWNPVPIYENDVLDNPIDAKQRLFETVTTCVQSWGRRFDRIVHELSGGLDSSIVLACLADMGCRPDVTCFNMYTRDPEGDEREYARIAAKAAGFQLVESQFRPADKAIGDCFDSIDDVSPRFAALITGSEGDREQLVANKNAQVIFAGRGGDHLFHRRRRAFVASEYAVRHGLHKDFLRKATEAAQLSGTSLTAVLWECSKERLLRRSADPYRLLPKNPLSINKDREKRFDLVRHPWIARSTSLPTAKRQQIFDLVDTQVFWTYSCPYADNVQPLISQPIIECILRIPTYNLTIGGRERALIRSAFSDKVPLEIISRVEKGAVVNHFLNMILENVAFIKEFLHDGLLVKHGLLSSSALNSELNERSLLRGQAVKPIRTAMLAEAWVRNAMQFTRPTHSKQRFDVVSRYTS